MKPPRGLSAEEAAAWAKLAATVIPFEGRSPPRNREGDRPEDDGGDSGSAPKAARPRQAATPLRQPPLAQRLPPLRAGQDILPQGLDSHWERRIGSGALQPDFTLDLHGHGLDAAHGRLMDGIAQARAMGARVVLLIAGKPRPVEAADRGSARGAIRAKVLDWLAASSHSPAIAAIRKAHRRHGGEGALYIVLRKER